MKRRHNGVEPTAMTVWGISVAPREENTPNSRGRNSFGQFGPVQPRDRAPLIFPVSLDSPGPSKYVIRVAIWTRKRRTPFRSDGETAGGRNLFQGYRLSS